MMKREEALSICPRCTYTNEYDLVKQAKNSAPEWIFNKADPSILLHRRCGGCGGTWEVELPLSPSAKVYVS
jgi:uncharacterized Zn finger protein